MSVFCIPGLYYVPSGCMYVNGKGSPCKLLVPDLDPKEIRHSPVEGKVVEIPSIYPVFFTPSQMVSRISEPSTVGFGFALQNCIHMHVM